MNKNTRGYSLIELLFTLSLVSVSFATALYFHKNAYLGTSLQQGVKELERTFNLFSELSMRSGRKVEVRFDLEHQQVTRIFRDEESNAALNRARFELKFPKEVYLKEVRFGNLQENNVAVFYPNGNVSPGRVLLSHEEHGKCALIQALRGARRIECY